MLSCPLATHFETLWLTHDNEHYARRLTLGVGLSIALHVVLISGIWFYQMQNVETLEQAMSTGAPNLPIRVELVTEQQIKQVTPVEPVTEKKQELVTETATKSPTKIPAVEKKPIEKNNAELKTMTNGNANSNVPASAPQASLADGVNDTMELSELRFRTKPKQPEYPVMAQRRNQQGIVVVLLTVETNGNISAANVAKSSGFPLLDKSVQEAAKHWQLYPFTKDGVPVQRQINVAYKFVIPNKH